MSVESVAESIPPGYKQTEVGVIPEDWDVNLLDTVAKRGSGHTPDKAHPEYWGGDIKWISLQDSDRLDQLYIYDTAAKITPLGIKNSSAKMHLEGTVVLSRDAGVGKSAIMKDDMAVSQHFIAWECGPLLKNHFLYYWLQSNKSEFERIAMGSTIKTIGLPYFRQLAIPLPPLVEQESIATTLSDTDALIESLEQLIAKKRQIKQGAMQELLTGKRRLPGFEIKRGSKHTEVGLIPEDWDVYTLGELIEYVKGFAFSADDYQLDGIRIIRVSDTTYDGIKEYEGIYINEIKAKSFQKWSLREGDLIISTVGSKPPMYDSLVGKATSVRAKDVGALLNQNAVIIRSRKWSLGSQCLLQNHLKQKRYFVYIEKIFRGNANQASITLKELFEYPIPLPPTLAEQEAIATIFSDIDSEITSLEEKLAKTCQIKQGMMQELLTGRIRLI